MEILDSWIAKVAILCLLLATRFVLAFKVRPRSEKWLELVTSTRESLDSALLVLILVFGVLQPFVAQAFFIPTGSMENTLPPGDRILTSKWIYRVSDPKFRDVVVFEAPKKALDESAQPDGTIFVKRCIGAPGDIVEIRNRVLFRNGVKVSEPYTRWSDGNDAEMGRFSYDMKIVGKAVYARAYDFNNIVGPWTQDQSPVPDSEQAAISAAKPGHVPAESYLMLGDHRNQSLDGHCWGFVPRQNIVGKAFAVFWPPTHWGTVDRKSAY